VSAAKIWVALSRGRSNIAFLIILTVVACILASKIYNPHRTPAGDALLADIRMLFARLKERAHTLRPGGETSEVALLMAVFGVRDLSPILFPSTSRSLTVVLERDGNYPPIERLLDELERARATLARGRARWLTSAA
jgi:hypothetical protein